MRENQFLKTDSNKKGFWGKFESFGRKNRMVIFSLMYTITVITCILIFSINLFLSYKFYTYLNIFFKESTFYWAISIVLSFVMFSLLMIFVTPFFNTVVFRLPKYLKSFRGNVYSMEAIPWFMHNALIYIVRYTVLEFFTPSPLNTLFYKMMGMNVGKGVIINTTNISDACLITLEDYVIIGGSVTLLTHYSQAGYLVVSKTIIKKGATIGLKASVFGDVIIGENATILPHSVVLPKSRLEPGKKYQGYCETSASQDSHLPGK